MSVAVIAGQMPLTAMLVFLAIFGGGPLLLLSIVVPLAAWARRRQLPRTVSIHDGMVRIARPQGSVTVPLAKCRWSAGALANDEWSIYTGTKPAVLLQLPDEQVACGFSADSRERWLSFFALADVPHTRASGCLAWLAWCIAGLTGGTLVGAIAGSIVWLITGNQLWMFGLGVMGAIEGAIACLLYGTCATTEHPEAARKRLKPLYLGLAFAVLALKFRMGGGLVGATLLITINGALGVLLGYLCQRRIRLATSNEPGRRDVSHPASV